MRRRILFLSQCLPYPPHSGVTNRTYHVLQELQRAFDVTLVAFSRRNHQPDDASRAMAASVLRREISDVMEPVRIESEWSLATKLRSHALSVLAGKPYIWHEYGSPRFGQELEAAIARARPDMVHLDSMDLYRWLDSIPAVPTACTHHNIESDLLRLMAEHVSGRAAQTYLMHQAALVEKVERRLCARFDVNVMTSATDAGRLRALVPGARMTVAPNGVDVEFFRPSPAAQLVPGRVIFLGPTSMFANRDAVEFFLTGSWPSVRTHRGNATFHLIGKNSADEKVRFERHAGVTCHGYVPDVRPHFAEAECSVVPLRVGGGTRLKILDAWSMGKAIVSTSIGCEGLETDDGRNILIRDDPADFADAVVQILCDRDLRHRLAREGRATAEEFYAWPVIGRRLNDVYHELLRSRAP